MRRTPRQVDEAELNRAVDVELERRLVRNAVVSILAEDVIPNRELVVWFLETMRRTRDPLEDPIEEERAARVLKDTIWRVRRGELDDLLVELVKDPR